MGSNPNEDVALADGRGLQDVGIAESEQRAHAAFEPPVGTTETARLLSDFLTIAFNLRAENSSAAWPCGHRLRRQGL